MASIATITHIVGILHGTHHGVTLDVPEDADLDEIKHGTHADIWTCHPCIVRFDDRDTHTDCTVVVGVTGDPELPDRLTIISMFGEYLGDVQATA